MKTHILTVDVEDNFTYEELVDKNDWKKYESQVVANTLYVISLLKSYGARATFFVVGAVAERRPEVVDAIVNAGFEVASHSYAHTPLRRMSKAEIENDIAKSLDILSAIAKVPVRGFRAMDFSIPADEAWFLELLRKYGVIYDSSKRGGADSRLEYRGNIGVSRLYPSRVRILGKTPIFSGGSYMRLLPYMAIKRGFEEYEQKDEPVVLYVHPWEFNRDQPRRHIPIGQKIRQSPLTFSTERKLRKLLGTYRFVSVSDYLHGIA